MIPRLADALPASLASTRRVTTDEYGFVVPSSSIPSMMTTTTTTTTTFPDGTKDAVDVDVAAGLKWLNEHVPDVVEMPDDEQRLAEKIKRECTSCKRRRLRDEDFEPDRKTCRECLRKHRRRHARNARSALEALKRKARETAQMPLPVPSDKAASGR